MPAIELLDLGERFRLYPYGRAGLKEHILRPLQTRARGSKVLWALRGVDLRVNKGEVFGIIGENGSGKTTLLKVVAGILAPDEGRVRVNGRVAALLDLGAAFHHDLSGRENLYLYGSLLGLRKHHIDQRFEDIVAYSGLEEFIDLPLRTYSSGMCMRLGFAMAVNVDPDILLVDEVFVVGDQSFQQKCLRQLDRFKDQGKTIVLVSHDMGLISSLCDRTALMRGGRVVKVGPTDEVVGFYARSIGEKKGVGILTNGRASLIFNNGHCRLLWSGAELTKEMAIFANFLSHGRWHTSGTQARWEVVETGPSSMVAQGVWTHLPVKQLWKVESPSDDVVRVSLETTVCEGVDLGRQSMGIMLSPVYDRWSAGGRSGGFPSQFNERPGGWEVVWAAPAPDGETLVTSSDSDGGGAPALSFSSTKAEGYTVSVENTDRLFEGRVVQYFKVNHGEGARHRPGDHSSISVEITIGRARQDRP